MKTTDSAAFSLEIRLFVAFFGTRMTVYAFSPKPSGHRRGAAAMTDRSHEIPQDGDLRNLVRVTSACTLGLWAFAVGLLIGTFLFS